MRTIWKVGGVSPVVPVDSKGDLDHATTDPGPVCGSNLTLFHTASEAAIQHSCSEMYAEQDCPA
jgi:hypothetical protein